VHRKDIYWHALPFNGQLEFFDVSLLEFAVQLTHELDVKFGLPLKRTMSQVTTQGPDWLSAKCLHFYGSGRTCYSASARS